MAALMEKGTRDMTSTWLTSITAAEKTCLIEDGKRKVHFKMPDGAEMVEEYSMDTNVLLRRAWKVRRGFSGTEKWEVEVGDPIAQIETADSVGFKENSSTPTVTKRITKVSIEWRIRNLPYPKEIFSVTVDPTEKTIVVKTSNKKYFKKINVPELERAGLAPSEDNLTFNHQFNTLIITYKKPQEVLKMEALVWECVSQVKPKQELGDVPSNCRPS